MVLATDPVFFEREDKLESLAEEYFPTVPELDLYHYSRGEQCGGPGKTHLKRAPSYKRYSIDMLTKELQFKGLLSAL